MYVFLPNLYVKFSGTRLYLTCWLPCPVTWGGAHSSARCFGLIWHILRELSLFLQLSFSPFRSLFLFFWGFGKYIQVSWETQLSAIEGKIPGRLGRRVFKLFSRTHWHFYFIGSVNLTNSAEAWVRLWSSPSSKSAPGERPMKVNLKGSSKCCSSPGPFFETQIAGPGQRPCLWHVQMLSLLTCFHHPLKMPCTSSFTCCKWGHVQGRCVFSPWLFLFQVSVMKSWTHFAFWMSLLDIVSFN